MKWNAITCKDDLKKLMGIYGGFHDGVLKEMFFQSGTYVDFKGSMYFNNQPQVLIIFQRQWKSPSVIEMILNGITEIKIRPPMVDYSNEIFEAKMEYVGGVFYWADDSEWTFEGREQSEFTWFGAKEIKWRERDDLIGMTDMVSPIKRNIETTELIGYELEMD